MAYKLLTNLNHGQLFLKDSILPNGVIDDETIAQLVADEVLVEVEGEAKADTPLVQEPPVTPPADSVLPNPPVSPSQPNQPPVSPLEQKIQQDMSQLQ